MNQRVVAGLGAAIHDRANGAAEIVDAQPKAGHDESSFGVRTRTP
jgi:hypothetical protein